MRFVYAALAALLMLAAAPQARAERIVLDYAGAAWGLIGVGGAHLDVQFDDNDYAAAVRIRTGGIAALFLHTQIDASSAGAVDRGRVEWRRYNLDHMYDGVHRFISMRPTATSVSADINPTYPEWGTPPTTDQQKTQARDPVSSLIAMAADVGATHTCQGDYMTFDGRWLYRLEVRDGESQYLDRGPYRGWAMRCRVRYFPVAGFAPDDQGYRDPPPPGHVWFALLDGKRFAPPVRATMPLPLGTAQLNLRSWRTESDEPATPQRPS
jgi:hypothetical protein